MNYATILLELNENGVARIKLNRPEKYHAMDAQMIAELHDAAETLAANQRVRIVVLSGGEKIFCAGGDLNWMKAQLTSEDNERRQQAKSLAMMLNRLNTLPQTTIAEISGDAYGGGVGLISVCDIAVAADTANFALSETKLGLIPATIGPYVFAKMGESACRRFMLSAARFSAQDAMQAGLLHQVVDKAQLPEAVEQQIQQLLNCSPHACAMAKQLIHSFSRPKIDEALIDATVEQLVQCWRSEDTQAGIHAFFNKEAPPWKSQK